MLSTNRRSAWIALGVFTLLAVWLLWDGFGPGRVLIAHESLSRSAPWSVPLEKAENYNGYLVEQPRRYYPYLLEAARVYAGEADLLWTSRGGGGQPFLGNMSSSLLYPMTWLVLVLPTIWVPWLQGVLVLTLGAFFTWLFLRRMDVSLPASYFGAVAFGFGAHQVLWLQSGLSHTLLALPFSFWAVERLADDPSRRRVAILALGFALFVLGGHPETGFVAGSVALLWALYRLWDAHGRMLVLGASLLALALSAVQWAPFLEYAKVSHGLRVRGAENARVEAAVSLTEAAIYSVLFLGAIAIMRSAAGKGFAKRVLAVSGFTLGLVMAHRMGMAVSSFTILFPELYGNPSGGAPFTAAQDFPGLNGAFVGVLPPVLLALGFFVGMGHGFIRFFSLLALLLWGAAHHMPGLEGLVRSIPGLGDVATTRLLGPVGFCTACGGAMVIDRLAARGVKPGVLLGVGRLAITLLISGALAILIMWAPISPGGGTPRRVSPELRSPDAAVIHDGGSIIPVCLRLQEPVQDLRVYVDGVLLRSGPEAATLPGESVRVPLHAYRMEEGQHRLRVEADVRGETRVLVDQPLLIQRDRQLSGRDLLMAAAALGCLGWMVMKHRPSMPWVLAVLVATDVLSLGHGYNLGADAEELFPPTQTADFLSAQEPPFRIFTEGTILPPDTQFVVGVDHLMSYDNMGYDRMFRWMIQAGIQMDAFPSFLFSRRTADYGGPRFDTLDVRYVLTDTKTDLSDVVGMKLVHESETRVWENVDNLGRAFLVGRAFDVHTDPLADLLEADPGEVALFETVWTRQLGGTGEVLSVEHRGREIEVVVETDGPMILILAENNAVGWTATIDDGEPIVPRFVHLAWQGVPVPEGRHTVLFRYDPPGYRWGFRASLAGLVIWLLMLIFPRHLS